MRSRLHACGARVIRAVSTRATSTRAMSTHVQSDASTRRTIGIVVAITIAGTAAAVIVVHRHEKDKAQAKALDPAVINEKRARQYYVQMLLSMTDAQHHALDDYGYVIQSAMQPYQYVDARDIVRRKRELKYPVQKYSFYDQVDQPIDFSCLKKPIENICAEAWLRVSTRAHANLKQLHAAECSSETIDNYEAKLLGAWADEEYERARIADYTTMHAPPTSHIWRYGVPTNVDEFINRVIASGNPEQIVFELPWDTYYRYIYPTRDLTYNGKIIKFVAFTPEMCEAHAHICTLAVRVNRAKDKLSHVFTYADLDRYQMELTREEKNLYDALRKIVDKAIHDQLVESNSSQSCTR